MKLSTAIRIGSMTSRQIKDILDDGNNGRCALGAAAYAVNSKLDRGSIAANFPILETTGNKEKQHYHRLHGFPTVKEFTALGSLVAEWNDKHNYTREYIADIIEMCEEAEEYFNKFGRESSNPAKQEFVQKESKVNIS